MISRPLREDKRHAAAAVVCMRDAYRSFQAEVVGQDTLELCLREGEIAVLHLYLVNNMQHLLKVNIYFSSMII